MTEQVPSKDLVKQLRDNAIVLLAPGTAIPTGAIAGALQMAADEIESARRRAEYWKAEHLAGNVEIERLRTTLTGISTCSTCEACRGAAERALGDQS